MRLSAHQLAPCAALALALAACNEAPTGPTVAISPDAPTTTQDLVLEFTEEASDPDDDPLRTVITWEVDRGTGFLDADLSGRVVSADLTSKGDTWRATVVTSDGEVSAAEEATAQVTVVNSPPVVTSVRISPSVVDTFGLLRATVLTDDADGDDVDVDLTWYVDGTALDVEGPVLEGTYFQARQEVWVEVTPRDGEDSFGETVASESVVIGNTAPRATSARLDPEMPDAGSDVRCLVDGWYDADGDPEGYRFTWLINGVEVSTSEVLSADLLARDQLVRCRAVPFDGIDTGPAVVSPPVKVSNTAPSVGSVSINESSPGAGDTLTFSASDLVDVDGDPVELLAEWFVDGELVHTGRELPPGSAVRDQQVFVRATPTDGAATGEPVESAPVTIVNTAPELVAVDVVPAGLRTDDVAFPEVEVIDVDGDRVTYTVEWSVNGSVVATTSTLDGDVQFDKGDEVQVTVTPTDGVDTGAALSSSVVLVANSLPTLPVITVSPAEPLPGESLTCTVAVDSTDADGDTLTRTLSWTRNGSPYSGATTSDRAGDTVPAEDALDGDIYTCTYSVDDGDDTVTVDRTVEVLRWRGPREFNPCGQTGSSGPSQSDCDSSYTTTTLDGEVDVSGGLQTWTAPFAGDYRIVATGAAGGAGTSGSNDGYYGAQVAGTFTLAEGDEITVLVGQAGESISSYSAGGGGGTFVVKNGEDLLLVAGGGGGNGYSTYKPSGCDAGIDDPATGGNDSSSGGCEVASTDVGDGGTYYTRLSGTSTIYTYSYGGGGAGLEGDGDHVDLDYASTAFLDGGYGAEGYYGYGGFGGGGTGGYQYVYVNSSGSEYGPYYSSYYGGGGGGGYTGGDGGYYRGGGGSSFVSGADTSAKTGEGKGDGKVSIDFLD